MRPRPTMPHLRARTHASPETVPRSAAAQPLVGVVVLNWNRWEATLACLRAIARLEYSRHFVVVVDNASDDDSAVRIRDSRPDVELLESDRNRGYAGGNNIGIRHALGRGADIVWILNNDTEPDSRALTELVATTSVPKWGIFSSCSIDPATGEVLTTARLSRDNEGGKEERTLVPIECSGCDRTPAHHAADALTGASLFIRREVFEGIGSFDERYFHYFEERDLVERARRAGWGLGLACRSVVFHEAGHTLAIRSPQATYYFVRNQLLYEHRFLGRQPLRSVVADSIVVRRHLALRHAVKFRDFRGIAATMLGIRDAVVDRTGVRDLGPRFAKPMAWSR
jgi:GT2 family glycosyltransferase